MKLIAQLKLQPSSEQAQTLRRTLEAANAACNFISYAEFCCVVCGHQAPADVNAAITIRDRADVRRPMVSSLRILTLIPSPTLPLMA